MIDFVVEDGTGNSTATSYVSVEESDNLAVMNIHTSDTWLALTLDAKRNLLIYASRVLDSRTTWNGTKTTETQALEWPRSFVTDRYGNDVSANSVPLNLKWAVVELAKQSVAADKLSTARPENVLSEVKIDTITLKFADPTNMALDQFKTPEIVTDLLRGLGSVRNSTRKVTFGGIYRK